MCARFTLEKGNKFLQQIFAAALDPAIDPWKPRYDITPGQQIPIVWPEGEPGERLISEATWGLILPWAKSSKDYPRPSNSRDDKLDSAMYKKLFRERRCVIPVDGFFEWPIMRDGEKVKHVVRRRDGQMLYVAGMWDRFTKEPEPIVTTTMVTTTPNAYTEQVHDRTIVILEDENAVDRWLDRAITDPAKLTPLVQACDPEFLVAYPVDYESFEAPDRIQPIGEPLELDDPRAQSQIGIPEAVKKKAAAEARKRAAARKASNPKPDDSSF